MDVRIGRTELSAAFKVVAPAIGKGSPPIISGVRIEALAGALQLSCTNLDVTIVHQVPAEVTETGIVIVPATTAMRITDAMGAGDIRMESDGTTLTISRGETVANLLLLEPSEWPRTDPVDGPGVLLSEQHLYDLVRIAPMASTDNQRGVLQTVHFTEQRAETTDSYRAALLDLGTDVPDALIPATVFASLHGPVSFTADGNKATFRNEQTTWTVRMMVGDYPNLPRLIRPTSPHRLTFPSAVLAETLGRVATLADDEHRRVTFTIEGDKARLDAAHTDIGTITDTTGVSGDLDATIAYNASKLVQIIEAAESDEITLELVDSHKPAIIRVGQLTMLLMPVNAT